MSRDLIPLRDLAAVYGVTAATLRQQIAANRLRAVKLGRDWYVTPAERDRYRRESLGRPGVKGKRPRAEG